MFFLLSLSVLNNIDSGQAVVQREDLERLEHKVLRNVLDIVDVRFKDSLRLLREGETEVEEPNPNLR